MVQLIFHLLGDYVFQSDWMAQNKTKHTMPALLHAQVYAWPFLLIGSWKAWLVILLTHFLIDRFRLARYVVYAKNVALGLWPKWLSRAPFNRSTYQADLVEYHADCKRLDWANCSATGYPLDVPAWMAVWLLIACDNTLHLTINYLALRWL